MLRREAGKSVSICDGFRKRDFSRMGRGFLPLLAVMLLATPQLAFAQGSLVVTVNPRSLDIAEVAGGDATATYTVILDAAPSEDVTITVVDGTDDVVPTPKTLTFTAPVGSSSGTWNTPQTVTVTVSYDENAVNETVTLSHTAMLGTDEVALSNVSVTVRVEDSTLKR